MMAVQVVIYETDEYKVAIHYSGGPVEIEGVQVMPKPAGYKPRAVKRQREWEPNEPHSDLPGTQELQL